MSLVKQFAIVFAFVVVGLQAIVTGGYWFFYLACGW